MSFSVARQVPPLLSDEEHPPVPCAYCRELCACTGTHYRRHGQVICRSCAAECASGSGDGDTRDEQEREDARAEVASFNEFGRWYP